MDRFDLRPRTVGEVLDEAFRLYLANAGRLIALVACVVVPIEVVWAIVLALTVSHGSEVPGNLFAAFHFHFVREPNGQLRNVDTIHESPGLALSTLLVPTITQLLSTAVCVRALADVAAGATPTIGPSVRAAVRRLPALVALFVIRFVGLGVGFVALIVPGVWLAGAWAVSVPAFVLEGASPPRALGRSRQLVRGRWWPVVGVIIVADLAIGISAGAVQALFGAVDGFSSHPAVGAAVLATTLGSTVGILLVQPLNAAVRTVLYLDLRIRAGREELDALADQLGVETPAVASPVERGTGSGDGRRPGDPPFWPPPPGWSPPEEP